MTKLEEFVNTLTVDDVEVYNPKWHAGLEMMYKIKELLYIREHISFISFHGEDNVVRYLYHMPDRFHDKYYIPEVKGVVYNRLDELVKEYNDNISRKQATDTKLKNKKACDNYNEYLEREILNNGR